MKKHLVYFTSGLRHGHDGFIFYRGRVFRSGGLSLGDGRRFASRHRDRRGFADLLWHSGAFVSWQREPDTERQLGCVLVEHLSRDDDGLILGGIMQFYVNGPAYAHFVAGRYCERLGACLDAQAARRAVEQRLEQKI